MNTLPWNKTQIRTRNHSCPGYPITFPLIQSQRCNRVSAVNRSGCSQLEGSLLFRGKLKIMENKTSEKWWKIGEIPSTVCDRAEHPTVCCSAVWHPTNSPQILLLGTIGRGGRSFAPSVVVNTIIPLFINSPILLLLCGGETTMMPRRLGSSLRTPGSFCSWIWHDADVRTVVI